MRLCTSQCKKVTAFSVSIFLIISGIIVVLGWGMLFDGILKSELSIKNEHTTQYKFWRNAPFPIYLEIYLFNWTNAAEFENGKNWTKPELKELGPYTFEERHTRANVKFNDNDTVSFNTIKTWHFVPEKSRGSLDDNITTVNTIALTVGNMVKHRNFLIKRTVSFLFEEKRIKLTVTKTAREYIFDGYNDTLLNILHKLDLKGITIPFDKFGWFYSRNGSSTYDGNFTMNTGGDDIEKLGIVTRWNQSPKVKEYSGDCGVVNGTTGELWYPVKDSKSVSLFITDICSTLSLEANGTYSIYGVEGNYYTQTKRLFDNGTKYPEMKCFSPGESLPSGVRNVSECKFGAPVFMSMPHFYNADPSYGEGVKGLRPDPNIHTFYLALEPSTGLPLNVHASLQVSLYLQKIPGINLFDNINNTMLPVLWFRQTASINEALANAAKALILLPSIGNYTGYGILSIGCLILIIGSIVTAKNGWKGTEDEEPLTRDNV